MWLTADCLLCWRVGPVGGCSCVLCERVYRSVIGCGLFCSFTIDTRLLESGQIFCAIPGSRVDGHEFVVPALKAGAIGVMVERVDSVLNLPDELVHGRIFIVVQQTIAELVRLASMWRRKITCPVLGITGSVGKTSTKEMLRSILLHTGKKNFVSPGNLNSILGVALSILRMEIDTEISVFEVGINDIGEIEPIAAMLQPSHGLITRIGHSHTQGLRSLECVAQEKLKLFAHFNQTNICILHGDSKILLNSYSYPVIYFGVQAHNNVKALDITHFPTSYETRFTLTFPTHSIPICIKGFHDGLITNALGAAAASVYLGCSDDSIIRGLFDFSGVPGRFVLHNLSHGRGTLIDDCYNASPESVHAAILTFDKFEHIKKIIVFGEMLELGDSELHLHSQVGHSIAKLKNIHSLILVGRLAASIAPLITNIKNVTTVSSWHEAYSFLMPLLSPDSLVLVKASKSVGLSNLVRACLSR